MLTPKNSYKEENERKCQLYFTFRQTINHDKYFNDKGVVSSVKNECEKEEKNYQNVWRDMMIIGNKKINRDSSNLIQ